MSPTHIQPGALADIEKAAIWYEAQRSGLGVEFILQLDASIERAAQFPLGLRAAASKSTAGFDASISIRGLLRVRKRCCRDICSVAPTYRSVIMAIADAIAVGGEEK